MALADCAATVSRPVTVSRDTSRAMSRLRGLLVRGAVATTTIPFPGWYWVSQTRLVAYGKISNEPNLGNCLVKYGQSISAIINGRRLGAP